MTHQIDADYLVVGAGAMGMAFTDALIDHSDATVALVDRRHSVGGHWLDAYPFVRLHQASSFYGVASTRLGTGRLQTTGPETGLHERATGPEVSAYYGRILRERMVEPGRVQFFPGCDYVGGGEFTSLVSGKGYRVGPTTRIVNARYLAPSIPALTPPPFEVDGADVIPVGELVRVGGAPSAYVVVGSGKTATDACIWLLANGVDPDDIVWVRPRDPWMLNRAVVQPDPAIFLGMAADVMQACAAASTPDDAFVRMEEAGVMLRIDRSVTPTMAKTPTLAQWELDELRSIRNVVRLGHVQRASNGRLDCAEGSVDLPAGALVVHCAADGLKYPPVVPIWDSEITLQAVRTGFPCFGAALIGFIEATIGDDAEKNRLCPPSPYSNTTQDWMTMQVMGNRSARAFATHIDIRAWADTVAINPSAIGPDQIGRPALVEAQTRLKEYVVPGLARMAELAGIE